MDRNHERAWWGLSAGATLVFGLACAAQFNDPDPLGWIGMYGAAAALSAALTKDNKSIVVMEGFV